MNANTRASVLVLDDDDPFRGILVRMLSAAGYAVTDTGNANDAIKLLDGKPPFHVLIADVQMPIFQPHGINVGNIALNKPNGPKVIYITGRPDQVPNGFINTAKTPLLAKPIRPDELIAAIEKALRPAHGAAPKDQAPSRVR
ncbi:MAG TPA: response regulator [Stellaceae bacterium]|nr:response regulator [Stellaceae bacterium]